MAVENCELNDNAANDNFRLLENKIDELIIALNNQGEEVSPMGYLSYLSDSTLFTGISCEEGEHEEISEVCVEHLRDLAKRDDYLNCLLVAQSSEISDLSDRIAVIQSSCCYGSEDLYDPIEELVI